MESMSMAVICKPATASVLSPPRRTLGPTVTTRVASNHIARVCRTSRLTGPLSCSSYERLPNSVTYATRRLQSQRSGRARCTVSATGGTNPASHVSESPSTANDAEAIKDRLRAAIAKSERGVVTDSAITREILASIESLERLGGGGRADGGKEAPVTTSDELLSATWKLLWTTEKETLFIFKQAPFFGTTAGDTFQTIDVAKGTLSNTITFPPSGMFDVSASIQIASAQRVTFQFTGARLVTASWTLPVPPFGQGWFDNTYIDEEIRISRDSRGDVLVTERCAQD